MNHSNDDFFYRQKPKVGGYDSRNIPQKVWPEWLKPGMIVSMNCFGRYLGVLDSKGRVVDGRFFSELEVLVVRTHPDRHMFDFLWEELVLRASTNNPTLSPSSPGNVPQHNSV
jgi:hypothetical protein